jgi:hypothetical protein
MDMPKINTKNFNIFTLVSLLLLIGGLLYYIYWVARYPNAAGDIGIYSITITLVLAGIFGILLTLIDKKEEST